MDNKGWELGWNSGSYIYRETIDLCPNSVSIIIRYDSDEDCKKGYHRLHRWLCGYGFVILPFWSTDDNEEFDPLTMCAKNETETVLFWNTTCDGLIIRLSNEGRVPCLRNLLDANPDDGVVYFTKVHHGKRRFF